MRYPHMHKTDVPDYCILFKVEIKDRVQGQGEEKQINLVKELIVHRNDTGIAVAETKKSTRELDQNIQALRTTARVRSLNENLV